MQNDVAGTADRGGPRAEWEAVMRILVTSHVVVGLVDA